MMIRVLLVVGSQEGLRFWLVPLPVPGTLDSIQSIE